MPNTCLSACLDALHLADSMASNRKRTRLFLSGLSKNAYDSNTKTYNDDWKPVNRSKACVYHKSRCELSIEIKLFLSNPAPGKKGSAAGIHRPSD